jgi:phosphoribosylformylglycinamidine synthase PurS subunit
VPRAAGKANRSASQRQSARPGSGLLRRIFAARNFRSACRSIFVFTIRPGFRTMPPESVAGIFSVNFTMKAKITVTPKKAVLDPQGKTVQKALEHMGYSGVQDVHVGKYIEIDLAPGSDPAAARRALDEACHKFLSNPIIEDYHLEMVD